MEYEELKKEAQELYNSTGKIFSPLLNEKVSFSSEGFNHIMFKAGGKGRERSSQVLRFQLLERAIKLLKISTTYQEYEENAKSVIVEEHKKKVSKWKIVKYWGLIGIIDNRKIKVIVRKIGNGNIHFWSVIPNWRTSIHGNQKSYSTMKGNPEED